MATKKTAERAACAASWPSRMRSTLRGVTRAAANAAKTACPRGHVYSGKNINGERICQTCSTVAQRRYREKKVANG
jgi:hypothetical protein